MPEMPLIEWKIRNSSIDSRALGARRTERRFEREQVTPRIAEMLVALGEIVVQEPVELEIGGHRPPSRRWFPPAVRARFRPAFRE